MRDGSCADPASCVAAPTEAVADGSHAALAWLVDLAAWRARADEGIADLPERRGVAGHGVPRNLAIPADRGVVRAISGQARYQVCTAAA